MKWYGVLGLFLAIVVLSLAMGFFMTSKILSEQVGVNTPAPEKIVFPQTVVYELNKLTTFKEGERLVCLYGAVVGDVAYVERSGSPQPSIDFDNPAGEGVDAGACVESGSNLVEFVKRLIGTSSLLGTIHNHPNGICRLGDFDQYAFGNSHTLVAGVICGEDDISVYVPKTLDESIQVIIN